MNIDVEPTEAFVFGSVELEHGDVGLRWLPGLGLSSPGGVDLTMVGPNGTITKSLPLAEALTASVVIDLFCPGSNLYETVSQLAPGPPTVHGRPER